jgi:hypothetical protein
LTPVSAVLPDLIFEGCDVTAKNVPYQSGQPQIDPGKQWPGGDEVSGRRVQDIKQKSNVIAFVKNRFNDKTAVLVRLCSGCKNGHAAEYIRITISK